MLYFWLAGCVEQGLTPLRKDHGLGDPEIRVEPGAVHFGEVAIGCAPTAVVTVRNVGDGPLDVSRAVIEGVGEVTVTDIDTSLPPDVSIPLTLTWAPTEEISVTGELVITSDDPTHPQTRVPIDGSVINGQWRIDTFVQDPDPVDVLWVIDNSGSMYEEQDRIRAELSRYVEWFVTYGVDFHMGVVTTDVTSPTMSGKLQGSPPWVASDTPDALAALLAALDIEERGTGDESGLLASELALSEPLASRENAGFRREDGRLAVIWVSDEPEYSAWDALHYVDFFRTLAPDPSLLTLAAIVGDRDTGCYTPCDGESQSAKPGNKYLDVVDSFFGMTTSVCTCDLGPFLEVMGLEATMFVRSFPLSGAPQDPNAILVRVNGEMSGDWTWDAGANAVVFDTPPLSGAAIEVDYALAMSCE